MQLGKSSTQLVDNFLQWYSKSAIYIFPCVLFFVASFFVEYIPYLNLKAELFSTILFFLPFFLYASHQKWRTKVSFILLGISLVTSILLYSFSFVVQSEAMGTVFYLLFTCIILKFIYEEARKQKSSD